MRMSREDKERSHDRIVASASRLVRERGVDGASVNDVMKDAGMTHGGFYKHFGSKDDLLAAALDEAFDEISRMLEPGLAAGDDGGVVADFQDYYLSENHLNWPSRGCPIAALGGEVARGAATVKARFGVGVRRITALLARGLTGSESVRHKRATRQLAMMAGAIIIARASDAETAREVLIACREGRA